MSAVDDFLSSHQLEVYELTSSQDAMMTTTKTVGVLVGTLKCRAIQMGRRERLEYEQMGLKATHRFYFSSDPGITQDQIMKFDGEYFWVRGTKNQALMDMVWSVYGDYVPQSQL